MKTEFLNSWWKNFFVGKAENFAEKTFEKVYGGRETRLRLVCRIGERKKVTFKEGKEKKMVLKTCVGGTA